MNTKPQTRLVSITALPLLLFAETARADEKLLEGPTAAHLGGALTSHRFAEEDEELLPPVFDDPELDAYRPVYIPSEEFSPVPRRAAYRGTSLGFGGALHFDNACPADGTLCKPESDRVLLLGTPYFDLLTELGWRHVRAAVGFFVAPVPHESTDYWAGLLFGGQVGVLIGYERLRAGATVGAGFLGFQALARLMVTPWRDRRGHRHGIEAAVGRENYRSFVMFSYRFAPGALNHVGGRRAALKRAEP